MLWKTLQIIMNPYLNIQNAFATRGCNFRVEFGTRNDEMFGLVYELQELLQTELSLLHKSKTMIWVSI